MPNATIMAVGYLITTLLESGMTIAQVLKEVRATGVVPDEQWDALESDLADAQRFWASR